MKYLAIFIAGSHYGDAMLIPAADCGPIVEALDNAFVCHRSFSDKFERATDENKDPRFPTMMFVTDEQLDGIPSKIEGLVADVGKAKSDWLEEYSRRVDLQKELNAIKASLKERGIALETEKETN